MSANNNVKALKSGIWYTASNFLVKSIGFITTPIFTRLLTHDEFGLYNNFTSWTSTFTILVTLNLTSTFISARFEFEDDFDGYISSVMTMSFLSTALWTLAMNLFSGWFVSLTGVEHRYLNIMMAYLLFHTAIEMFQVRERYYFEYKISVLISMLIAVGGSLFSVILVLCMEDRLAGRIIGHSLPQIIIGLVLLIYIYYKGREVNLAYWKYALPICAPFIPHLLSLTLLNSMDRIMITRICGAEDNALYSLAYNCGTIITLLITSLNTAFAPWLGEKLKEEKIPEIRRVSEKYILLFVFLACGIMLVVPEVLIVMGGRSYMEAMYVMPPVAFGCVCQFLWNHGFKRIHLAARDNVAVSGARLFSQVLQLGMVDVGKYVGRHDDTMMLTCCLDATLGAAPAHDDGTFCQSACQNLVPSDEIASTLVQEVFHLTVDIGLELVLSAVFLCCRQSQLLNLCLTLGTLFPTVLGTFVSADMDELRGEYIAKFAQHFLEEYESLRVAAAKHVTTDSPIGFHRVGTALASKIGEHVKGSHHVAGQIDFRDDIDVSLSSIAHNLATIVLGIVASVALTVVDTHVSRSDNRLLTHTSIHCQSREPLYLEAPSLVVGQVPMELVAAVQRHHVEILFDEVYREEMTGAIQQHTSIAEAGRVGDANVG